MTQHIIDNSFRSYVPKEYVQNCKVFKSVSCPISDGTVPFKMLSSFGVGGESEGARDVSDRTGEVGKKRTLSTNQQRTIRRWIHMHREVNTIETHATKALSKNLIHQGRRVHSQQVHCRLHPRKQQENNRVCVRVIAATILGRSHIRLQRRKTEERTYVDPRIRSLINSQIQVGWYQWYHYWLYHVELSITFKGEAIGYVRILKFFTIGSSLYNCLR